MAWSCPAASPVISTTNYMAKFTTQSLPGSTTLKEKSCLPNNGDGFTATQVDSASGIVSSATLNAHVISIQSMWNATPLSVAALSSIDENGIIESQNLNPAKTFSDNSASLRESIKREYCFYYNRYSWGLREVLTKAAAGTTDSAYTTLMTNVGSLNSKLNQILQILQTLARSRKDVVDSYHADGSGVNTLNSQLSILRDQLVDHSTKLKDKSLQQNVQSAMIDYSLEKNASSRNLLGIYGFMNIVAIGLLFYLYRSSKA
jgi:hypothetical protein